MSNLPESQITVQKTRRTSIPFGDSSISVEIPDFAVPRNDSEIICYIMRTPVARKSTGIKRQPVRIKWFLPRPIGSRVRYRRPGSSSPRHFSVATTDTERKPGVGRLRQRVQNGWIEHLRKHLAGRDQANRGPRKMWFFYVSFRVPHGNEVGLECRQGRG